MLDIFRASGGVTEWLKTRNWRKDAAAVSNEIQNYGTMLQYARDFQAQAWCDEVLNELYQWLDQRQSAQTDYWGYRNNNARERSLGVQTGYHLWCLYFFGSITNKKATRIILHFFNGLFSN